MKIKQILLLFLFILLFKIINISVPYSYDEIVHGYIAKEIILKGKLPYVDAFDQKPFAVYIPHIISNIFPNNTQTGGRIIGILISIITIAVGYFYLQKVFNTNVANIFVLWELLIGSLKIFEGQYNLLVEQQLKLPIILTIVWINSLKSNNKFISYIYGGLLISWLSLLRQTYGIIIVPIIIYLFYKKNLKNILILASTSITPWILSSLPYVSSKEKILWFFQGIYLYNSKYYTGMTSSFFIKYATQIIQNKLILIMFVLASISTIYLSKLIVKEYKNNKLSRITYIFVLLFLLIGIFSIYLAGNKIYLHYAQMIIFPLGLLVSTTLGKYFTFKSRFIYTNKLIFPIFIINLLLIVIFSNKIPKFNNNLSTDSNNKIMSWITKYKNLYFTGQSISYYFDNQIPIYKNLIITDLPFLPNHRNFYNEFISNNNLYIVTTNSYLENNQTFMTITNNYYICDYNDEIKLYCPLFLK